VVYVSEELTHFVGAGLLTDEARYDLLAKTIIASGTLLDHRYEGIQKTPLINHGVRKKNGTVERQNYYPDPYFEVNVDADMRSNMFVDPERVCFCDIPYEPIEHFRIHTAKYMRFGIAFKREFLIAQGANPVFYIANSAATQLRVTGDGESPDFFADQSIKSLITNSWDRQDFFDELRRRVLNAIDVSQTTWEQMAKTYQSGITNAVAMKARLYEVIDFPVGLFAYVFGYTKFFDPRLSDEDPQNFYMEREWRVLGRVRFKTQDVARLFAPPTFAARLRDDVPGYAGPIVALP
jgi:hypothetical protein